MHNLLKISLTPSVPASLCNIPTKYNIIICLWMHSFYKLLESLCCASFTSPLTLKHLQYFIYYTYTFYTGILEGQTLHPFWAILLEALGDPAHYHMAMATMVTSSKELTLSNVLAGSSSNPSLPLSSTPDQPSNTLEKSSSMSKKQAVICLGCNKDLWSQRSKYKSYGALRGCNLGARDCLQVCCGK